MPSLLMGGAIAVTTILAYSAMAGFVGGGGLGDIAIRYGYYRYQTELMIVTVVILVIIVQLIQELGALWKNILITAINKRRILHEKHLVFSIISVLI